MKYKDLYLHKLSSHFPHSKLKEINLVPQNESCVSVCCVYLCGFQYRHSGAGYIQAIF